MDNDTLVELAEDFAGTVFPHGSGINYNWSVKIGRKTIEFFNSYEVMNEFGCYIGKADFSVVVDKKDFVDNNWKKSAQDFALHFHNKRSHYLNRYYGLREYLENELFYTFDCLASEKVVLY